MAQSPLKKKLYSVKKQSKSPLKKKSLSLYKKNSTSPKNKSPKRSVNNKNGGEKIKFYDLLAKKPFYSNEYKVITRVVSGKNGKRKVTYYVTQNPTPKKDGSYFDNWKIFSNTKA